MARNWDRETLGRFVRKVWVEYYKEIGGEKPSHLAPWEEISEEDREADRRIGEELGVLLGALECDNVNYGELGRKWSCHNPARVVRYYSKAIVDNLGMPKTIRLCGIHDRVGRQKRRRERVESRELEIAP